MSSYVYLNPQNTHYEQAICKVWTPGDNGGSSIVTNTPRWKRMLIMGGRDHKGNLYTFSMLLLTYNSSKNKKQS